MWTAADAAGTGGVQDARIVGLVDYKDRSYCKAEYEVEAGGQQASYVFYFNEDMTDGWMVTSMGGQTTEFPLGG